jgi:hypothetical protein
MWLPFYLTSAKPVLARIFINLSAETGLRLTWDDLKDLYAHEFTLGGFCTSSLEV